MFVAGKHRKIGGAFTLIELLIVIAIIAILALIALPNFLESQVRAKVARVKADMRSVATALEAYYVDYNAYTAGYETRVQLKHPDGSPIYPGGFPRSAAAIYGSLTTPVAYLTTIPSDKFVDEKPVPGSRQANNFIHNADGKVIPFSYETFSPMVKGNNFTARIYMAFTDGYRYVMSSVGPKRKDLYRAQIFYYGGETMPHYDQAFPYDPTNGTISNGLIYRTNRGSNETQIEPRPQLPLSALPPQW